ncbi:MAG: threonine--tRNA ligase [Campylobacteraceae bacterium]|nr:threonine--tRNA ligase [Campylobacteraceae bacterium]
MKDILGYKLEDQIIDTQSAQSINLQNSQEIIFDNSKEALEIIRHSTAHLMAEAIKELYPDAKFFVGPTVDEGFYYDFKTSAKIGEEDLVTIEKKMKELADKANEITKYTITKAEALKKFENDELKQEVLKKIDSDEIGIYAQGGFEDLCRGPHVPNTKYLKNFKLIRVAGAYLGGDESKEMLTRIYGIAFADKETLKNYVTMLEEAKKRDHRKVGHELGLFAFDEDIGSGMPIWLPAGARLRGKLEKLLYHAHLVRGYEPVRGPEILKSDLWKKSGHYQNYGQNMYFTNIEEAEYGIKPMNCLSHIKIFDSETRGHKELPLKFFEFGVVHRHEKSGVLHGLLRVREFTQDDAHIFCTESQIKSVIYEVMDFVDSIMKAFDFNYSIELATKPQKAIGSDEFWDKATKAIADALDEKGMKYDIDEGGGAFYGPKIDVKITDCIGRKWQCGTIQVDLNLPDRFDLNYTDDNNQRVRPVMIHRAIIGSFERFIAILTEHFGGEFPFFIAPTQVILVPIGEAHVEFAKKIQKELIRADISVKVFDKNESLGKKIRNAEKERVPLIAVIGDQEVADNKVSLRDRREKRQYEMGVNEFVASLIAKNNGVFI